MNVSVTAEVIYKYLKSTDYNVTAAGNLEIELDGFCSLQNPKNNSITWVKHAESGSLNKFTGYSSCLIVAEEKIPAAIENVCFLITDNPKAVFFTVLNRFWNKKRTNGIGSGSIVETDANLTEVSIGHNCYIGEEVEIGTGTVIEHNVSIYNKVKIGNNCIIHSGAVIGSDGFGYYMNGEGIPEKVPHYGGVYIGDDVEIGANACIDRGTIDDTVIASHVKIDNLVHIAHNVKVEEASMIIAGSIICGSALLGNHSYVAPGGIIKNQLKVGDNALVGMGAVVTKNLEKNKVAVGVPAKVIRERCE